MGYYEHGKDATCGPFAIEMAAHVADAHSCLRRWEGKYAFVLVKKQKDGLA